MGSVAGDACPGCGAGHVNDPVPVSLRWGWVLALAAVVLLRSGTAPVVVRVAVLGLAGLAVLPVLGWLRTLWFAPVAAAGAAAAVAATLLHHGQAVPVALVIGTVAGAAVGAGLAAVTARAASPARPWLSLLAAVAVWAFVLPRVGAAPTAPPLMFGIDLGSDGAVAVVGVALFALGVWVVGNLAASRVGRQMGAAGSSPVLAIRSGATIGGVWLQAGMVSGALAGWAGVLLVMDAQAVPRLTEFSPVAAVTWLAVPLIGGPAWISGVLVGATLVAGAAVIVPGGEAVVAGIGLLLVALTRGQGVVGAVAERVQRA